MGDYEIGIRDVHVQTQRSQKQSGQAAHGEQTDEAEGVQHGGRVGDGALIHGRGPIEDLDGRGHGNQIAQQRENQRGVERYSSHKHVVRPDKESEHRDCNYSEGHEFIAENAFTREASHDLANHTHARQNHDVYRRMRVEPEEMLEQQRVAAFLRIENAEME